MQVELANYFTGLYPLVYLLVIPLAVFHVLKVVHGVFGVSHSRAKFLRQYLMVIYGVSAIVFLLYFFIVRMFGSCG